MNSEAATLSENPLKNMNLGHYLWCLLTEHPESYLAMIACDTHTTKMYCPLSPLVLTPKRVKKLSCVVSAPRHLRVFIMIDCHCLLVRACHGHCRSHVA